jgi:hypothetical protein
MLIVIVREDHREVPVDIRASTVEAAPEAFVRTAGMKYKLITPELWG